MQEPDPRYDSLRKLFSFSEESATSPFLPRKISPFNQQLIRKLSLLRPVLFGEKIRQSLPNAPSGNTFITKNEMIRDLSKEPTEELAKIQLPQKYRDPGREILTFAWREKITEEFPQTLTLRQIDFSEESFRCFMIALSLSVSFRALRLDNCFLDERMIRFPALLLKIHPSLAYLYLDNNPIGDEGVRILCKGLKENSSLQYLSLRNTGITDKSLEMLEEVIRERPMRFIDSEDNGIDPGKQASFQEKLLP